MKDYIHARLGPEEKNILKELKKATGENLSGLVKKGLRLVYQREIVQARSVLDAAGDLAGCFASGVSDLATNKKHLKGFGE